MHMDFMCQVYRIQAQAGRYFLHEHPALVTSWMLPFIREIAELPGVTSVLANMCSFGMTAPTDDGNEGLVYKPTRWLTNAPELAKELARHRCNGDHDHVRLLSGKAAAAQVYPPRLCATIARGISRQMRKDVDDMLLLDQLEREEAGEEGQMLFNLDTG